MLHIIEGNRGFIGGAACVAVAALIRRDGVEASLGKGWKLFAPRIR